MKYNEILEKSFDEDGKAIITTASGKQIKDDKSTIKKVMTPGEFIYTKFKGETITFGQDEEEPGKYFVSGRSPKSYKDFDSFEQAYKYWEGTYR